MPPKGSGKKGGKKGKMARMMEEQRILQMEQKEEKRRKKEEMLTQSLKDKLTKEEKNTAFNLTKLQNQWRVIMREAKSDELKKEIKVISQTFERVIYRKDAIIKLLLKDLDEAEEQYQTAFKSHIQNLKKLLEIQEERLLMADEEYDQELEALQDEFDTERSEIIQKHKREMDEHMDIIYAMEQEFENSESEARQEFHCLRDEIRKKYEDTDMISAKEQEFENSGSEAGLEFHCLLDKINNKNLEDKQALRIIQLAEQKKDLIKQKEALKGYNEKTEKRANLFKALETEDENSTREIEMLTRKIQRMKDKRAELKAKVESNSKEDRNRLVKEEKKVFLGIRLNLQDEINKFREQERARLTTLTLQSNAAIKELKRKKEKGKRILKLSEMCRKLETEEEKVLPLYASSLTPEEEIEVEREMKEKPSEPLAELFHEYSALENFWKRYNKVLLDKLSLDNKKRTLLHENQQLRSALKQYLDGISVSDEILSQTNPLFIVNNKTNVKLNIPVDPRIQTKGQHTVEAAHIVKHTI